MAHLWHLPFKVPESKFCQPCENGPNDVDLAHVSTKLREAESKPEAQAMCSRDEK